MLVIFGVVRGRSQFLAFLLAKVMGTKEMDGQVLSFTHWGTSTQTTVWSKPIRPSAAWRHREYLAIS
jgi:hypothetical protein